VGRGAGRLAALLAVTAVAVFATAGAGASSRIQYGIQDDAWLLYGPEPPAQRIQILQRLGVDVVRMTLRWDSVASREPTDATDPDDAAYDWTLYDPILERLHDAGIDVLLTLWGTPEWANGGAKPNRIPTSAVSLADFAFAASTKYPWVHRWTVWNEPNLQLFLRPNSPALYVGRLLNPAYRALKEADPRNLVAGGVTSPRPTPSGLSPIAWIRGMRAARARLDAYAQNPYPVRPK
jgi:polysaccharide biosynthesis protein PslG